MFVSHHPTLHQIPHDEIRRTHVRRPMWP
jgi:hypothetical protein